MVTFFKKQSNWYFFLFALSMHFFVQSAGMKRAFEVYSRAQETNTFLNQHPLRKKAGYGLLGMAAFCNTNSPTFKVFRVGVASALVYGCLYPEEAQKKVDLCTEALSNGVQNFEQFQSNLLSGLSDKDTVVKKIMGEHSVKKIAALGALTAAGIMNAPGKIATIVRIALAGVSLYAISNPEKAHEDWETVKKRYEDIDKKEKNEEDEKDKKN